MGRGRIQPDGFIAVFCGACFPYRGRLLLQHSLLCPLIIHCSFNNVTLNLIGLLNFKMLTMRALQLFPFR